MNKYYKLMEVLDKETRRPVENPATKYLGQVVLPSIPVVGMSMLVQNLVGEGFITSTVEEVTYGVTSSNAEVGYFKLEPSESTVTKEVITRNTVYVFLKN